MAAPARPTAHPARASRRLSAQGLVGQSQALRGCLARLPAWPAALLALTLTGCVASPDKPHPDYNSAKAHHRPDGFTNRYASAGDQPGFLRWQWERLRDGLPKPPTAPITGITPDVEYLRANTQGTAVTWIGHATVLLQLDGLNILTDPHWGERASPVSFAGPRRHQPPGVPFEQLPPIHAVLISHNHFDHLDHGTVQRLMDTQPGIRFFVPLGVQRWFQANVRGSRIDGDKPNVIALDWADSATIEGATGEATLRLLAVQHWSSRTPWDRNQSLWGSWAVLHPHFRFWFSGDLGYSQDTRDIGRAMQAGGGFDLAAIAIGAYEPRWFMRASHINPAEAVQVMRDVGARAAFGIHWGTFEGLTDEPLDQPPRDLQQALQAQPDAPDFRVLRHGQTWKLR